jgi:uncharacterized alpha-E superfamily protein
MILPLSTAANLYWLGRYLVRVDGLCNLLPFTDDLEAQTFAHAFNLPAWNAETLNALIHDPSQSGSLPANLDAVKQNIQSVRGVLSAASFEAFHALCAHQKSEFTNMTDMLASCRSSLKHESPMVQLFLNMGESLERIDISLRMIKDPARDIREFSEVLDLLPIGWQRLKEPIMLLNKRYDRIAFYDLSDRIQELFRKGV